MTGKSLCDLVGSAATEIFRVQCDKVLDGEFWRPVLQLECEQILECFAGSEPGRSQHLSAEPLPSAADKTLLLLLSVHPGWTHGQLEKQLFDKQGDAFHLLISFVVKIEIFGLRSSLPLFLISRAGFPAVRVTPESQTYPKVSLHLL